MKKILSLFLCITICICMFSCAISVVAVDPETPLIPIDDTEEIHMHCACALTAQGLGDHICDNTKLWSAWDSSKISDFDGEAYYYLTENTTVSSVTIASDCKLHICLNGYTLSFNNNAFSLLSGSCLEICDCSFESTGKISATGSEYTFAALADNSNLNLFATVLDGGTIALNGNGSVCNLYNATVKNSASNNGNIYLSSGSALNMYGASLVTGASSCGVNANEGSVVTFSDTSKIIGNTGKNLYLLGDLAVGDTGLDVGAQIGITASKRFLSSDVNYSAFFTADDQQYSVKYSAFSKDHGLLKNGVTHNKKIDIYLVAGQSNAVGNSNYQSPYSEPSESERDKNVYNNIKYYCNIYNTDGSAHGTARHNDYGPVKEGLGIYGSHIGPELGMAEILDSLYAQKSDTDALILKHASGATSLLWHQDENGEHHYANGGVSANPDALYLERGSWYPTALDTSAAFGENRPSGFMIRKFKENIAQVYNDLLDDGYAPANINFVTLNWMQGESDRTSPAEYEAVFPVLIKEIKDYISTLTNTDYSALPLAIGEISETQGSAVASSVSTNKRFISMQRGFITKFENCKVLPLKDFKINSLNSSGESVRVGSDESHWKYTDMLQIGQIFANADLDLLNGNVEYHNHCVCGDKCDKLKSHTCDTHNKWIPIYCAEGLNYYKSAGAHYLYLTNDIDMTSTRDFAPNEQLYLCLNGHTLNGPLNSRVFSQYIAGNSEINICDCSENEIGVIKANGQIQSTMQGMLDLCAPSDSVSTARFNLYSGTLKDGKSGPQGNYGGNIAAFKNSVINMYGGTIEGGTSYNTSAGNIAIDGANVVFNMYGGVVQKGNASNGFGGNISISNNATFNMHGGSVLDGEASKSAGNIGDYGGKFNMYGGLVKGGTSNNTYGGNITVEGTNAEFNLYDGTIENGYAKNGYGGNISTAGKGTFNMYGGSLLGGKADKSSGNLAVVSGTFVMTDGVISGGTAGVGGNVYIDSSAVSVTLSGGSIVNSALSTGLHVASNVVEISGTLVVKGNATGNLKVDANKTVAISNLTEGADIGITSNPAATFGTGSDADCDYLHADANGKIIVSIDNSLFEKIAGDVNLDGAVNVNDAFLAAKLITKLESASGYTLRLADINHDGVIDVSDCVLIVSK